MQAKAQPAIQQGSKLADRGNKILPVLLTAFAAIFLTTVSLSQTYTFTNASAIGMNGPTQAQINTAYTATTLAGLVTINTQGVQEWIVPATGIYRIEADGAEGGQSLFGPTLGGRGAIVRGEVSLTAGTKLYIIVGQKGGSSNVEFSSPGNGNEGAGGGGSFVAFGTSLATSTSLMVAGAGAGGTRACCGPGAGLDAATTTAGVNGNVGGAGGINGNGGLNGSAAGTNYSSGGGGFFTGGQAGQGGFGGAAFVAGGIGGIGGNGNLGYSNSTDRIDGGFGSGGSGRGSSYCGGGGGGGYSGGGSGASTGPRQGGGGGSFIFASAVNVATSNGLYNGAGTLNGLITNLNAWNLNQGKVVITLLCPTITVTNPAVTTGTAGVAFSQTFTASGGAGPYTFTTASTLPAGLGLSTAGVLSGTPTQAGTFPIVVTATDAGSCTGNGPTYNLVINCITNNWLGGTSNNWFTASNWSCGIVPTATTDVDIPAGTPNPCVIPSGTAQVRNLTINAGAVLTNNGTLNVNGGGVVTTAGIYKGSGTFNGALYNNNGGVVAPGNSPGCTVFGAGYTNGSGTEQIEIGGLTPCTQHDQLQVTGTATLSGILDVVLFGGFVPSCGDSYKIMTSTTLVGTFATINYPALPMGLSWSITYNGPNPGDVTLSVSGNPVATATPAAQTTCSGSAITTIVLTSTVASTTYTWTRNNTVVVTGIAASGTGNISGTLTNTTTAPVTVTFTITPTSGTCVGPNTTATVTVNPVPNATATPSAQTICSGTAITTIVNSGTVPGTVYNWVRNNTVAVTGIPASGTGNIGGVLTNTTTAPVTVTFTITPSYTNAGVTCTGTATTATVIVNPTPTVNAVASQVKCNGAASNAVVFSGNVAGTVYNWVNDNTGIGLAASGSGNIAPFTVTNATVNPITGNITVTPTYTNAGTTCTGTPTTFSITVNPTATVDLVPNQIVCGNSLTAAINFSSPSTGFPASTIVYNWVNTNTGIGLSGSGNGNIPAFIATNNTTAPLVANITVTPTYTYNGVSCTGTASTFSITVNPRATANAIANQSVCNTNATAAVNFSSIYTGGSIVYNWTNNDPSIGLAASGAGNIASFTATNVTTAPVTATIVVTPTYTSNGVSCVGTASMFTITVNPTASVDPVADETLCANQVTVPIVFTSPVSGTVYNWVNNNPSIGLAASGTGNIPSFTTANNLTNATTATITVRPTTASGCIGTAINFTITVNPIATVNAVANQVLCNGSSTAAVVFSSPTTGGTIVYNWTNSAPSIGIAASGTGNIPTFVASNITTAPVIATITVTPTFTNGGVSCVGTARTFTITVNPTATVNIVSNQKLCNGDATTAITFTSPNSGGGGSNVVFNWVNNTTSIGLAASGTGNIPSFVVSNTGLTPAVATITVTPTYTNGGISCTGTARSFTITVLPVMTVNTVPSQVLCNGAATAAINFSSPNSGGILSYNWFNDNTSIGLTNFGSGNIASFTATNATASPVTANITVTPVFLSSDETVSCTGVPSTFTITVNPTATINPVSNQTLCANQVTTPIVFSGPVSGTTYSWVNNNPSIGLAASGNGNIPSFTTNNNLTNATTATIIVTPTTTNGCTGVPISFTITVNPIATVNAVANQVLCNGASTAAIVFSSPATGGTIVYNWTNNAPSIGIAASGSGNIPTFVATNNTTTPVVASITVTPTFTNNGVSCVGTPLTFSITVNPTATVNAVANQTLCANQSTTAITFTSPNSGGGGSNVVFNWVNNTPSIGLATSGTGNIGSFTATNTTTAAVTATITVTPVYTNAGITCTGTPRTFTITVNPTTTVNAVANQVLCNGASTAAIVFSSPATGGTIVYNWTNTAPSIGIAASGTGNIPTFVATNNTTTPVVASITVTPTFTNNGVSCVGTSLTFSITVNPTATVNAVANQTLCANQSTTAITFTSPNSGGGGSNVVFNWVNNTPSIGLAANGSGNIASFIATNAGNAPVTATITVTPTYTNAGVSCAGTSITFTITVNPSATVNPVANQSLCNNSATTAVNFSSTYTGGSVAYNWTNTAPSIGLAASGTGNIASFTATNTTNAAVTATITVTPTFTSGGVSCAGTASTFTITVYPTATVSAVPNQTLCGNTTTAPIVFSSAVSGVTYTWVNNNTAIGLGASGTGNIPSFVTANNLTNATTATITVTPSTGNGCTGTPITFTITVNPIATVNAVANQVLCNGSSTAAIVFSSPATGGTIVYNWTNNAPSIGIAASGTGNIPTFVATNITTAPVVASITVTPTFTNNGVSCVGTPLTFTITVNPTATVNAVANQTLCANQSTTAITFTSPNSGGGGSNVVFNWVNNTPSIGLAASGSGNIASFVATNASTAPVTATITVTPTYTNAGVSCAGTSITFTITVNPSATVNPVANQSLCNNSATAAVNFSSTYTGGTIVYNWTNSAPSIGLAASGTGNIASFTATNTTNAAVTATITVTPTFTNGGVSCTGTSSTFTITVYPTATVNAVPNQTLCGNTTTAPIVFSSAVSGVTYTWVNNNTAIGLGASGTGNIPSFVTVNNLTNATTATITVTPSTGNGCTGTPITFTITVNPIATVNAVANQVLCNGSSTAAIVFSSPATGGTIVYNWTNNAPSIGIAASGTGNIPTFVATNITTAPVVASITVTPTFTNNGVSCVGTPLTFTITVNPTATVNAVANQTLCANQSTTAITFTSPNSGGGGSNVVFNWANNNTGIGLAASGAGNIPSFTATNNSNVPVVATITVTPTYTNAGVSCVGTAITFTITVNPTATVNPIANQSLCNNNATAAVNFSSTYTGGTIVYNWINNTPSIGLAASGAGNIASFIATNATSAPVTATITVTPTFTNSGVSCVGTSSTFTITVNPTATVNPVANQTLCANTATAPIVFSSPVSGTTYTWVNNNPSIGLAASGSGNIPSFVTSNTLTNATTATITVTPSIISGCTGAPITFTITVNPIATVNTVANQVLCNGSSTAAIVFSSPTTGGTIVYNWTNNAPSIGIAASGTGNIPTFIATNNTTTPVVATITVTPTFTNNGVSCVGIASTFTITVNPTATVNAVANQVLCNGSSTSAIGFTSPNSGGGGSNVVFNWVNNTPSIGLAVNGTGNIGSFVATNATTAPITATIIVTPTYTNGGVSCVGTAITFTITVNPTATVNAVANQSLCNNTPTAAVNFSTIYTGGTVVYNWVNNTPSIGLAATGAGNIASFIATNATNTPITATITITPTFTNAGVSCVGTSSTFTITVNPTGNVNAISNQIHCANATTLPIVFSSGVAGTTYSWVNNNPSIGLGASGTGNIPSFVTANNLTNAITATITVTPTSPNGCTGLPITFTITVNPVATVNAVANQVLCNGSSTAAIAFSSPATGGSVIFTWSNNAPSIGLAAAGAGNIPTFIATNTTTAPVVATITVTPTFINGGVSCVGTSSTFTITVNPTATVNAVANQVLCNASSSTPIIFTSPNSGNNGSNIVFNWVNNTPSIGLAANGAGNIASFIATNTTTAPVVATITVTPTYISGGVSCVGTSITFNITVNPTATVNAVANQSLCNNVATAAVNFSSTYTGGSIVYNWVNNTPSIGLAATGAGNIASFIATNATSAPVTATITVTATFTNGGVSCVGTSSTFTITVNPTAVVNAVANQSLCANTTTTPIVFSSPVSGTTYTWVNNNTAIGLAASGVGNIPSFVTTNNLNSINATITVTPNSPFGCTGLPITFVITVNPIATVNVVANQILCNGRLTDSIKFTSPNGNNGGGNIVYNWTNTVPSIGLAATGSGNILPFTATNAGAVPVIAIITVTPSFVNGTLNCVGITITFSITVNPTAVVNAIANQTVCAGQPTTPVSFTGAVAGATYNWVNSNPLIGLPASGSGNIASFIAQNPTFSTITGTITVTPNTSFGCVGSSKSFDIIVPALSVAPTAISTPSLVLCDTNTVTSLRVVGGGLGTGANWVWYRDACGGTPIGTGAVLNNITVGNTTTFYVRAEGTCNITACASVRVQVAKLVTHVRQHWNDVLFFDNSSNNFVKWQWYKNGAAVPGATQQHYTESGGLNGNYYVVATDKNGNDLLTCPLDIAPGGFTGIQLKISPNPVSQGQTYRLISSLTPAELQGASITVRDIIGTQVTQTNTATPVTTLLAPNASGMYIVTLLLRNGQRYSVTMIVR